MTNKTRYFLNGEELHHVESLTVEYDNAPEELTMKAPFSVTIKDVALPLPPCEHGRVWYLCRPCVYRLWKEQQEE